MSIVALGEEFPSIWSRPIIRAVDTRIFQLRYFRHCMDCGFCGDQCCDHGVDVDVDGAERIRGLGPDFELFVGTSVEAWFTPEITMDEEFPGGAYRRTRAPGGACVFRAKNGRGCLIHAFCLRNGLDYHLYKPLVSTLFPLTFEHGVLVASNEVADGSLGCSGQGESLYVGVREELLHFFGARLVARLDALAETHLAS